MSAQALDLSGLSPERKARFKQLTSAPKVSWPVVGIWALVMSVYISSDALAFLGVLPLWAAMIINSVIGYYAFTVVHDAIHRAISTNTRLNDFIGQTAVFLGAPYVDLRLFRWAHILHHRFTSGPKDPDIVLHGAAWTLPFRWMAIDLLYLIHTIRYRDKVSQRYLMTSLWLTAATGLVFGGLIASGYGWHVLMLWFIPSRIIFLTLGFSFFWLPHVPHDTRQEDNLTRATAVRIGHEWLLSPLLQCQNYHLIHHLYPMTPFLNNRKVWTLLEPELRQRELAIQHDFRIHPKIYPASGAG
ncbi:fatty acid desaturase [Polycyclovorans algicola]|uniref:fatty acid desaturase n=1 Tax=Polycyclovorans algicola TaxID=616992 RepID=UPI000693915F|nr:fatty acid desaturase [Polycyclovorans algicola]